MGRCGGIFLLALRPQNPIIGLEPAMAGCKPDYRL